MSSANTVTIISMNITSTTINNNSIIKMDTI